MSAVRRSGLSNVLLAIAVSITSISSSFCDPNFKSRNSYSLSKFYCRTTDITRTKPRNFVTMLTKKSIQEFKSFVKIAETLRIFPFSWDNNKSKVKVSVTKLRRLCCAAFSSLCFIYQFSFFSQLFPLISSSACYHEVTVSARSIECSEVYVQIGWLLYFIFGFLWGSMLTINFWKYRHEYVAYLNATMDVNKAMILSELLKIPQTLQI